MNEVVVRGAGGFIGSRVFELLRRDRSVAPSDSIINGDDFGYCRR
jgi:nucleoside-diphosphate-sugar epimerase